MNKLRALWADYKGVILGLSVVLGLCLVRFALGLPCPIRYLSGISCPGCGMTRALWSFVTLDLAAALHYHPAALALPVAVTLLILFRWKGMKKASTATLVAFGVMMVSVYLWRLFAGGHDVVVCAPRDGLIYRLLTLILPH